MNVWALNKDNGIRRLLHVLLEHFGPDAFKMSGRWDKDVSAVGLFQPGDESMLAYIYTYGQDTGRYGLHLEYPGGNDLSSTTMIENIELSQVIELLKAHFDI
jgi:hypothetical protein